MPLRVHTRVYASRRNAHGLGSLSAFGNKWRRTVGVVTVEGLVLYTPPDEFFEEDREDDHVA